MTKDKILMKLKELTANLDDPELASVFKDYNKMIQFIFPDLDIELFMKIANARRESIGVAIVEADLKITMDSGLFFDILDKREDPKAAYESGRLKAEGDMPSLVKLQKLLP